MPLVLRWADATRLPVSAEGLLPAALAGASIEEVARRPIAVGNARGEIGEVFRVEGDGRDGRLVFEGDLRGVRAIGAGLSDGAIEVRGDAGHGLGVGMIGGTIDVFGAVGDNAGAELRGGLIRVRGDAGDNLGGALPGSRLGMRDGVITVDGGAGDDAGLAMRRGLVAVLGRCGRGAGRAMVAGTLMAFGPVGDGAGSGMKRGTIALFGDGPGAVGPTFAEGVPFRPVVLAIYLRALRRLGLDVPATAESGTLGRYLGDRLEDGKGEILVGRLS